jgi:phosphate transport system substrate-binding protein
MLKQVMAYVAAMVLAGSLFGSAASAAETVVLDGSTTVGPIAKAFAEYFEDNNPGVDVTVSESGSGNGAKSLINGTCDIGNMSRFMKIKEFKAAVANGVTPVAHVVAMDGIAMVVHPSNPVKELTLQQIKDIYLGKITNWRELGGPNMEIVVVSRDTNSGTYETFEGLVMNKEKVSSKAEVTGSNGQTRTRVQKTRGAIGYVGLGYVDRSLKSVPVNGVQASFRTVASGQYPISRPLYMFTNGYPKLGSPVHAFVTIHLSKKGQEMVKSIGFVPVTDY